MLAQSGIDVEVVDVRTLMPLDKQTIFASVEKTNRVIVTDEEASARASALRLPRSLPRNVLTPSTPVKRVAAANVPMPFSPELEKLVVPRAEDLVAAVRQLRVASTAYRHCPASLAGGLLQSPGSVRGSPLAKDTTRTSRGTRHGLEIWHAQFGTHDGERQGHRVVEAGRTNRQQR